MYTKGLWKI